MSHIYIIPDELLVLHVSKDLLLLAVLAQACVS